MTSAANNNNAHNNNNVETTDEEEELKDNNNSNNSCAHSINTDTHESIAHIDLKRERTLAQEFVRLALDSKDIAWTNVKTSDDDIRIQYAYIRQANICTIRSSVTVDFTCDDFFEFVNAYSDDVYTAIKKYDDNHSLVYSAYNAPVPKIITPRDFCYLKHRHLYPKYETGDGKEHYVAIDLCYSVDADFPDYVPVQKNRVRGEILMAGLVFDRLNDLQSRAYYLIQLDPKGWIPHWIVNLTAPQQGYNIKWVRDYLPKMQTKNKQAKK